MVQDECHRWSLIGLASWGEGCGTTKFPGVYTRVSHFMEWILKETMDSMTCDAFNEPILYPNLKGNSTIDIAKANFIPQSTLLNPYCNV
ncbi:uncharacterized protein CEXT_335061 [Caerostris extrusa]|uniref:Peptidase S1 domain-containing protein n=1 Tax=Caerostris extrusa TaxID=172846 RepID=A0AAV4NAS3_CAEEX|nr:uncharacterized protein CEXT_335061 [Caerostris extrusa]